MWWLDFRMRDRGGGVQQLPALYRGAQRVGEGLALLPPSPEGVTFVTHGYNNSRDQGMSQIRGFVRAARDDFAGLARTRFVGVLWPGDAIFGFLSYPTEEADADDTAAAFARTLWDARLPRPVHLVAHSLGSRLMLQTATTLARWDASTTWVDQIVLLAAAVDDDCLARTDRYVAGVRRASRLVNVASTADRTLRYAFPAGDWAAGLFTGGYTRAALGRHGPAASPAAPAHVRPFQVGRHGIDHDDYLGGVSDEQKRASRFTGRVLERDEPLVY